MPRIVVRNPLVPGKKQRDAAVLAFRNRLRHRELHQRSEHVDEGNELQHHRQRQKLLKCFLHSRAAKFRITRTAETIPCTISAAYGVA